MAQLPDLTKQERPLPQPGSGLASYRPNFGGAEAIGQATSDLGVQLKAGGDELYANAKIEQEKIDTLKAEEAFTKLRQRQLDLTIGEKEGYSRIKGAGAVNTPIVEHYSKQYQDAQLEIENGLKTSEQLAKFRSRANMGFVQFQDGLVRHRNQESDSYAKEVTDGILQTEIRQATANWNSSIDVGVSLIRIDDAIRNQGERLGMPTEQIDGMLLKAKGQVHSAVIQQALASGNTVYAQEWYEKYKADIDAPTAKALETATKNGYQKQIGAQYDAAFLAARDDPQQLRALETNLLKDQTIDEDRKNRIHGRILSRQDALAKQAELGANRAEKYITSAITRINGIVSSGYEPPAQDVEELVSLSRGTPMQAEVDRMVNTMELTRKFRAMDPMQKSAEIIRLEQVARSGGAAATQFDVFTALRKSIEGAETGGQRDPANAASPVNKGGVGRAMGRMQIIESTFNAYKAPGEVYSNDEHRVNAATRYLADLFNKNNGDVEKTAAQYIGGPTAVTKDGRILDNKESADVLGTTPRAYANKVKASVDRIIKSSGGMRFDIGVIKNLERMRDDELAELKKDPTTYFFRQGMVPAGDPALTPLDMSKPEALDYKVLARRGELATAGAARYGSPEKPLTEPETAVAVNTLRRSDVDGKINYFSNLLKTAQNRGPDAQGMRDDMGGARRFQSIMAQIAPDEPVLAFAGVAAGAWGDSGEGRKLAEMIIKGHAILNPNQRTDGKPAGGSLIPMPGENKMRLEFDNMVGDALRSNPQYEQTAYQAAKAVYAAMPATKGKDATGDLDVARWQEAVKMTVGNVHDWNGKRTVMPTGMDYGRFKDELNSRIDAFIASGRLIDTMTPQKLRDMQLRPAGFDRYVFTEGDKVLSDKTGKPVIVDFKAPAPWTPVGVAPIAQPTAAELEEAKRPYFGKPTKQTRN